MIEQSFLHLHYFLWFCFAVSSFFAVLVIAFSWHRRDSGKADARKPPPADVTEKPEDGSAAPR